MTLLNEVIMTDIVVKITDLELSRARTRLFFSDLSYIVKTLHENGVPVDLLTGAIKKGEITKEYSTYECCTIYTWKDE